MAQKTSKEIRELNFREPKAWKVLDQYLVINRKDGKKIPASVQLEAACFILKRLYPERMKLEGAGKDGLFNVTVEIANENSPAQESRSRVGEYFTV